MRSHLFQRFFNIPGDGGGAGAGGVAPAPASPAPSSGAPAPSGVPGPAGSGAAPTGGAPAGGAPAFSYGEDRSTWVPPYRLNEVQQRHQQLEQQFSTLRDRMAVMMGIGPQPDPEQERVRQAMIKLFPELGNLGRPQAGDPRVEQVETTLWRRHAADMSRMAVDVFARTVGKDVKDIGQGATRRLARELRGFIEDDPQPDAPYSRMRRYEEADPTLIDEMVSELTGFYVQPAQVQQNVGAAGQVQRARSLPSAGVRTAPVPSTSGQPKTFANKKERFAAMRQDLLAQAQA